MLSSRKRLFVDLGLVIVLLIAVGIVGIVLIRGQRTQLPGVLYPSQGNFHIAEVDVAHPPYNSNPPTSGPHVGRIASWGSYDYELPDELLVHNMEDGGVILWYRLSSDPEVNAGRARELKEASRGYSRVVIVPRSNLDTTFAMTAWTRLDKFDEDDFSQTRIRDFLEAYEGIDHHVR